MTYSLYSNKKPKTDREDTQKRRRCLKCRTLFMSAWQGERICTDCKQTSVWRTGEGWLPGEILPSWLEDGLSELVARGLATCDSFASLRQLLVAPSKRRFPLHAVGRWSFLPPSEAAEGEEIASFVIHRLLRRYGVLFPRILGREKLPVPWREMLRVLRVMELRGDVRGGRFVSGFSGEQYALPEAVKGLRRVRRERRNSEAEPLTVAAADPLNLRGILTPDPRVSPTHQTEVVVG